MRLFNAFQIVSVFVACPFFIAWLADAGFRGADAAFYSVCALYAVGFAMMVVAVANLIGE